MTAARVSLTRRRFVQSASLAGLGLLAGCGRLPGQAHVPAPQRVARLGYLSPATPGSVPAARDAFVQGLHDLGWIEGQNIVIEDRYAEGRTEEFPDLAADLIRLNVEIILAVTTPAALAAKRAADSTPIVFDSVGDPVGVGLVSSLAQPGGNVTGPSALAPQLSAKRLQLLTEAIPGVSRVGVLWSPSNLANAREWSETQVAGEALQIAVQSLPVWTGDDFPGAFEAAVRGGADSLFVLSGPVVRIHRLQIADFAARGGLPTMYPGREYVEPGGLMSYGTDFRAQSRRAAYYVDRILKGAKPADLPVEQPTTFEFVINLKTAQALGLTIPQHVLLQATEIIQ
jgi:putative ABC transport system substrate-binding protein